MIWRSWRYTTITIHGVCRRILMFRLLITTGWGWLLILKEMCNRSKKRCLASLAVVLGSAQMRGTRLLATSWGRCGSLIIQMGSLSWWILSLSELLLDIFISMTSLTITPSSVEWTGIYMLFRFRILENLNVQLSKFTKVKQHLQTSKLPELRIQRTISMWHVETQKAICMSWCVRVPTWTASRRSPAY